MPCVADVVGVLEQMYDPRWAEPWDAVGLVCGDPSAPVRRVLFAVDPVATVGEEAVERDCQLVVTHHPLYLRGTTSVAATTAKGRLVQWLVTHGVALHVAHTNADVAAPGVSDALAATLGLSDPQPLDPRPPDALDKLVTFVPREDTARVVDALAAAGAGRIGDYSRCAYLLDGTGTFRPEPGAHPALGTVGQVEVTAETRVEMVLARPRRADVVRALLAAHPYEEPAYDVYELALPPGPRGLGRVGALAEPMTLHEFTEHAAAVLPATAAGLRALGDPDRAVGTVAVCGGAGGDLAELAHQQGADVLLTADLRHHPASELAEEGAVALVDAAHWATEHPWLAAAATRLRDRLAAAGTTVETLVSRRVTDPWTVHAASPRKEPSPTL